MSQICPGFVSGTFTVVSCTCALIFLGIVQDVSLTFPGDVSDISRIYSQKLPEHMKLPGTYRRIFLAQSSRAGFRVSQKFPGQLPIVSGSIIKL